MLDELRDLIRADPFVPFRIVLANGDGFDVRTANMLMVGESVTYLTRLGGEGYVVIRNVQLAYLDVPK